MDCKTFLGCNGCKFGDDEEEIFAVLGQKEKANDAIKDAKATIFRLWCLLNCI